MFHSVADPTDAAASLGAMPLQVNQAHILQASALGEKQFSMSKFVSVALTYEEHGHVLAHLLCLDRIRELFGPWVLPHPLDALVQCRVVQLLSLSAERHEPVPGWRSWIEEACRVIFDERGLKLPPFVREDTSYTNDQKPSFSWSRGYNKRDLPTK
jgi:hypothetical protein